MLAYHLRIKESRPFVGDKEYLMDAIYLPERDVMFGFLDHGNKEGMMFKYKQQHYLDKANQVIENKRPGEVVGIKNIHDDIDEFFMFSTSEMKVKTVKDFDGSTDCLVKIINGEYRKKGVFAKLCEFVS